MSDEKICSPSAWKAFLHQIAAPVVAAVIVGLGSGAFATWSALVKMDSKLTQIEKKSEEHKHDVDRELARQSLSITAVLKRVEENGKLLGDHERRIVRLEAQTTVLQSMLEEVRADVKTLLKASLK